MTELQWKIAVTGTVLAFFAVVGIVARRRYRIWWFFSLYLVAVLVLGGLPQAWPERFHTPEFWQLSQTVYAGLRFAFAAEVGIRTMRAFPGAMATARRLVLLILLVTLVAVATPPVHTEGHTIFVGQVIPRVLNGSVWMLMAIAAVILWYRLPVHPFHKAVLLSYIPYVLVFTVVASYVGAGWQREGVGQYAGQIAYVALMAYWNYAIWRKDPPADRGREQHPLAGAA
jgi:hypothetical protein